MRSTSLGSRAQIVLVLIASGAGVSCASDGGGEQSSSASMQTADDGVTSAALDELEDSAETSADDGAPSASEADDPSSSAGNGTAPGGEPDDDAPTDVIDGVPNTDDAAQSSGDDAPSADEASADDSELEDDPGAQTGDDAAAQEDEAVSDDGLADDGLANDDAPATLDDSPFDDAATTQDEGAEDDAADDAPDEGMSDDSAADDSAADEESMSDDSVADDSAADDSADDMMSTLDDEGMSSEFPETGLMQGMTAAHNAVRAAVDTDEPLPELSWSEEIAAYAQEWADFLAEDCSPRHRDTFDYGENIATFGAAPNPPDKSPEDAVSGWAAEIDCWEYGQFQTSDSCDMQCVASLNANGCGHYTQLVWRGTTEVGCGMATCQSGQFNMEIWVCNYGPPGNWIGEFPY